MSYVLCTMADWFPKFYERIRTLVDAETRARVRYECEIERLREDLTEARAALGQHASAHSALAKEVADLRADLRHAELLREISADRGAP